MALIIFVTFFALFIILNRKKFKIHSFAKVFYVGMLRTNFGLKLINKIADKHRHLLRKISPFVILIGFLGMIVVVVDLIYELSRLLSGTITQSVGLVLPIEGKGIFYVPFVYWIISVFIVMIVHEGGHGIMARAWGIKVKKTGIAFVAAIVPLIPAAFVEPDEKQLSKASKKKQLSVFAAGPFANIVLAFVILLIMSISLNPLTESFYQSKGIEIIKVSEDSPAQFAGISEGEIIKNINGNLLFNVEDFTSSFTSAEVGDLFNIQTDKNSYEIILSKNPETEKRWAGIFVEEAFFIPDKTPWKSFLIWLQGLFFWIFLLNLGVGLFNLVPIGPIDGGKMLQISLHKFIKFERANRIWKVVSIFVIIILLANLLPAFIL